MKLSIAFAVAALAGLTVARAEHQFRYARINATVDTNTSVRTHTNHFSARFLNNSIPSAISLRKRDPEPATDEEYNKCQRKGSALTCASKANANVAGRFFNPPLESTNSQFDSSPGTKDLYDWAYTVYDAVDLNSQYGEFDEFWGVGNALRRRGLSDATTHQGGHNEIYYVVHGNGAKEESEGIPLHMQEYRLDGVKYYTTSGYFAFAVNALDGVIMAMNRNSPRYAMLDKDPPWPGGPLPKLIQSSDVMWAIYKDEAEHPERLRYFFSLAITNDLTLRVIEKVVGGDIVPYPGIRFSTEDLDGQALLGTPNGVGIGYMLVQHKRYLSNVYVKWIEVFECENHFLSKCMLFIIEPYEEHSQQRKSGRG